MEAPKTETQNKTKTPQEGGLKVKKVNDESRVGVLIYKGEGQWTVGILLTFFSDFEEAVSKANDESELKELVMSAVLNGGVSRLSVVEVFVDKHNDANVAHTFIDIDLMYKEIKIKPSILDEEMRIERFHYPYQIVERIIDLIHNKITLLGYVNYVKDYIAQSIVYSKLDETAYIVSSVYFNK